MRSGRGQPLACMPIHREDVQRLLGEQPCADCQRSIYRLLALSKTSLDPNVLPARYIQHADTGGRLFEENHLQETTRRVRSIALAGMWDYDISNCHFTLIAQLAERIGLETPWIDDYLANKSARRSGICNILEVASGTTVDEGDVKAGIIALAYGMSLYRSKSLSKIFRDQRVANAFSVNPWIRAIHDEVLMCRRALLKPFKTKSGGYLITNAQGFRQSFGAREYGRALSFLVTGVESAILDQVLQGWGSEIVLCIHDGWVSRTELPVREIEERIARETGFRVTIEVDRILPKSCSRCDTREKIFGKQKSHINHATMARESIIGKTNGGEGGEGRAAGSTKRRLDVGALDPGLANSPISPSASTASGQLTDIFVDFDQKNSTNGWLISNRPRWAIGGDYKGAAARGGRPLGSRNRLCLGSSTVIDPTVSDENTFK